MKSETKKISQRVKKTASSGRADAAQEVQLIYRSAKVKTSRQRLTAALQFEETDRIPIDLGGFQTGIHKKHMKVSCVTWG